MIEDRIAELAAMPVSSVEAVAGRGYTPAKRLLVTLEDGSTAFAKVAVNESTAEWLALEHVVYSRSKERFFRASSATTMPSPHCWYSRI